MTGSPNQQLSRKEDLTVEQLVKGENVKARFSEVLGKRAPAFISSLIAATKQNRDLAKADPMSVISAGMVAATLGLPINPNLGFAHLVPYRNNGVQYAQFQMGWKGYVQLAVRTNQYERIHTTVIFDGELVAYNRITGELVFDINAKTGEKVIGYYNRFKLLSGYVKEMYMTVEECERHARRYSKLYQQDLKNGTRYSKWSIPEEFDFMGLKTVTKLNIGKWGPMSADFEHALNYDQAVVRQIDGAPEYLDNLSDGDSETQVKPAIPTHPEVTTSQAAPAAEGPYAVNGQVKVIKDLVRAAGLGEIAAFDLLQEMGIEGYDKIPMSKYEQLSQKLAALVDAKV